MIHNLNPCVKYFVALSNWATPVDAPNPYRMVIYSDRRSIREHVRLYNGPKVSEIAEIIPGAEEDKTL